jgi:hypothetical protein
MSAIGPSWVLGLAASEFILILILLTKITSKSSVGFSLSLAFITWITFKHGFVRFHVFPFILFTPLIVSLCITKIKRIRTLKLSFLLYSYVLAIALYCSLIWIPLGNTILQDLNFGGVVSKTSALLDLEKTGNALDADSLVNLYDVKLPQTVTDLLKGKNVDIIPWEVSLVEANKLNWQPRPIFQSYSAYTSFLDRKNSESILGKPRDYIIYQFASIDDRHPFFDEPETFFNIFCNYKLSSDFPNFINTSTVSNLILLEKRNSSICSQGTVEKILLMRWNNKLRSIEVSDDSILRAAVNIKYSSFGKIYKTLFRSPPVMMDVTYANGSKSSYRIIPENSHNGVMINYLPQNDSQTLSLFEGQLDNSVKSFSFFTSNALLYKPNIDVVFTSYNVFDPTVKKRPVIVDISQLKSINFLPTQTDEYMGVMDSKQESFSRRDVIYVYGWATRKSSEGKKPWVLLTYGYDNRPLAIVETGASRPDVAKYFNNSKYIYSGWSIKLSSGVMAKGVHDIKAWIYNPTNNSATPLSGIYRIEIR